MPFTLFIIPTALLTQKFQIYYKVSTAAWYTQQNIPNHTYKSQKRANANDILSWPNLQLGSDKQFQRDSNFVLWECHGVR